MKSQKEKQHSTDLRESISPCSALLSCRCRDIAALRYGQPTERVAAVAEVRFMARVRA